MFRRSCSFALALCVSLGSSVSVVPSLAQAQDPVAEAQQLYAEGQHRYDTLDYEGAIEIWMRAFAAFPQTEEFNTQRATVLYAIAQARMDLFEGEGEVKHLTHAKRLMERYLAGVPEEDEGTRAAVQDWLDRLNAKLPAEEEAPAPEPAAPAPEESRPADPASDEPAGAASESDAKPPGRPLLITGAVLTGIGVGVGAAGAVVFGGTAAARSEEVDAVGSGNPEGLTLAEAQNLHDEGQQAETLQILMLAAGSALAVTGVALLAVGASKNKVGKTALAPAVGPRFAGLSLQGKF